MNVNHYFQNLNINRKRSFVPTLAFAVLGILVTLSILVVIINPPQVMVRYYDDILPQRLLEAQFGNQVCVQLPVREPVLFYQVVNFLTYQPEFICFNTSAEANTWMQENMPSR